MGIYRLCFFDDDIILGDIVRGRFDFEADDDDRAAEIAEILFEACSDRCQSWGIWEGNVFVESGPRKANGVRLRASDLAERRLENIVEFEEIVLHSEWPIASSKRLLAELDKLKASKRGASGYPT
jgi:hypothetical protein